MLVDYGPDEEPEESQSEVVNGNQRFLCPRTLKRKPEAPVTTPRKRGKEEIIDLTTENSPVSGSQELSLGNRAAAEPLITTPQQQSSAHNNTPRMLTPTASTQGGKTESMGGDSSSDDPPGSLREQEHQALIGSIREDVTSLQSRVDALEASAPLPGALKDVRKLMGIILQKLPS